VREWGEVIEIVERRGKQAVFMHDLVDSLGVEL